jgi:hypothetical protein
VSEPTPMDDSATFGERLIGLLNDGALALMLSVGHRTGLFDVMASLPSATSAQIAEAAELNERYVREWLAAMTTGGIVVYDDALQTFALPARRAAWLTRAAGPDNLALQAQYVGLLAMVEDQIARPDLLLSGIAAALRPDGVYLCVDIAASSRLADNVDHPMGPFLYTISCMHCMTVSLASGGMASARCGESRRPARCSPTLDSTRST